jgi:murein DD-endopeptidase MepM/ murein hydrolase activator NlpD
MRLALTALLVALPAAPVAVSPRPPSATVTVIARAIQPGEIVLLDLTTPEPWSGVRATAFDRPLAVYAPAAARWRVLVGIDLDVKPGDYTVSIEAANGRAVTHTLSVKPKRFPTRQLTVNEAFVNPPASALERIRKESTLLAAVWADTAPEHLWRGPFLRPVPHQANSAFGSRSVFNGQPRNPHGGADFLSPAGTAVKAPNAGRVVLARDLYYSGRTVILDHGLGVGSHFGHLSEIAVTEGTTVGAGDIVGKVGATGRVTGPHLHWSVRIGTARVDPLSLLAVLGK